VADHPDSDTAGQAYTESDCQCGRAVLERRRHGPPDQAGKLLIHLAALGKRVNVLTPSPPPSPGQCNQAVDPLKTAAAECDTLGPRKGGTPT
jgi:hypothetical protein